LNRTFSTSLMLICSRLLDMLCNIPYHQVFPPLVPKSSCLAHFDHPVTNLIQIMATTCLFVCLNIEARSGLGQVSRSGANSSHRGGGTNIHKHTHTQLPLLLIDVICCTRIKECFVDQEINKTKIWRQDRERDFLKK
jgi:hypothetical protein